jgi:hypothetical protein
MKLLKLACGFLMAMSAPAWLVFGPAPEGDPSTIAVKMIATAGHPCPAIASAIRLNDYSIQASCSNGEVYRITTVQGVNVALQCSTAKTVGITRCQQTDSK